jgi:hypothetical protein
VGKSGKYVLLPSATWCRIGQLNANGPFLQYGTAVTNTWQLFVCSAAGTTGLYMMAAGQLWIGEQFRIGQGASRWGTFVMSNGTAITAINRGTYVGNDTGPGFGLLEVHGASLVGNGLYDGSWNVYSNGTIRGWGTLTGGVWDRRYMIFNGRIVADGEGAERTLDITWATHPTYDDMVRSLSNTVDNVTSNGLFAVNHGKLSIAKPWVVPPGVATNPQPPNPSSVYPTNVFTWGESIDDPDLDMVNSARISFSGMGSVRGELGGTLYAPDRSDVPVGMSHAIGIWNFTNVTFTFSTATVQLRYDHTRNIQAEDLRAYHYEAGQWQHVTASRDGSYRITTTPVSSLGWFAVAPYPISGVMMEVR